MFDRNRLKEVLVQYKKDFPSWFTDHEKFKWEAVKCFQRYWNENASDFSAMLEQALRQYRTEKSARYRQV